MYSQRTMYTVYRITLRFAACICHLPNVLTDKVLNAEVTTGQQLAAQQKPTMSVPADHADLMICKQCDMKLCLVRCHLFSSSSWLAFMSCCQRRICAGVLGPASAAATLVYAR